MTSEERRHLFIADEFASISLFDTPPDSRAGLVIQWYRLVLLGGNIQQHLGRQILVGLRHFADSFDGLFKQLCHEAKYSIVVWRVTVLYDASAHCLT